MIECHLCHLPLTECICDQREDPEPRPERDIDQMLDDPRHGQAKDINRRIG